MYASQHGEDVGAEADSKSEPLLGKLPDTKTISCCEGCFRAATNKFLNLDVAVEVIGPPKGMGLSIVIVHGAGGSRAMFRRHAQDLASAGYRCVLLDLPGHGGRWKETLTLDSAIDAISQATADETAPYQGVLPVYLGASLGGFIGMELLGRRPRMFSAAIICCAAQTVGAGASFLARGALGIMSVVSRMMFAQTFVNQLLGVCRRAENLDADLVMETTIRTGFYFSDPNSHVTILRRTNSVAAMKQFFGPVMYADGAKDHHDMGEKLLAVAKANETVNGSAKPLSRWVLYPEGDHFFTHDRRYCREFVGDVVQFLGEALDWLKTSPMAKGSPLATPDSPCPPFDQLRK